MKYNKIKFKKMKFIKNGIKENLKGKKFVSFAFYTHSHMPFPILYEFHFDEKLNKRQPISCIAD